MATGAATPADAQTAGAPIAVDVSAGDQFFSHGSGDWIVYSTWTEPRNICYYHLADASKRGCLPIDSTIAIRHLADVSGTIAVFYQAEWIPPATVATAQIATFDLANLAGPIEVLASGGNIVFPSIGGPTIAYLSYDLHAWGDIVVYDRVSQVTTMLTNDAAIDESTDVSADGSTVVWTKCAVSYHDCTAWQAVKQANGTWTSSLVQGADVDYPHVETDGTTVAFVAPHVAAVTAHPQETDICWRPVAGGAMQCLDRPGFEHWPTISGRAIVFESRLTSFDRTNLYLLDTATGSVTALTDSPLGPHLPNVWMSGTTARVTWTQASEPDNYFERDVFWTSVVLPPLVTSPSDLLQQLIDAVAADNLRKGLANSLDAKLSNAQAALGAARSGQIGGACGMLAAFINEVQAQSGKGLTVDQASAFLALATAVRNGLGCP